MNYLTAKQFSQIWGITERRIIKLCNENRIDGAIKNGMVWEIPENTLKPSDKRSNIYKYINIQKKILIINMNNYINNYLINLLEKAGFIVESFEFEKIYNDFSILSKYYEGLIFFLNKDITLKEEKFINKFSEKLNSDSSIVILRYKEDRTNKIEERLSEELKMNIGARINTLILDVKKNNNDLINYDEIAEDIFKLFNGFKNTTGMSFLTDGGKIEFNKNGKTKDLNTGEFYRAINNCFKRLDKNSYLWCASTMLEDEWTEEPLEMKFRILNLEIANRGVNVERIFIFSKNKIKEFKNNKTLKIYMQSNIKTLFVDYDEIIKKEPKLLKILKDGWDGIDKDILISDLSQTKKQRGYITKNTKEVLEAYECFQKLKKYSKNLKDILK